MRIVEKEDMNQSFSPSLLVRNRRWNGLIFCGSHVRIFGSILLESIDCETVLDSFFLYTTRELHAVF